MAFLAVFSEMSWACTFGASSSQQQLARLRKARASVPQNFARARCDGFAFFLRLHARPVRARANRPIARAHYSTSAADMVMIAVVH